MVAEHRVITHDGVHAPVPGQPGKWETVKWETIRQMTPEEAKKFLTERVGITEEESGQVLERMNDAYFRMDKEDPKGEMYGGDVGLFLQDRVGGEGLHWPGTSTSEWQKGGMNVLSDQLMKEWQ